MTTPKELELKLQLAPTHVGRLKRIPLLRAGKARPQRSEVSVYFDTPKHKLRRKGLMLRVRRTGRRYVQTVKTAGEGSLLERGEWENDVAGNKPDFDLAARTALGPLLGRKLRAKLQPVFETDVRRTVYPVRNN